MARSHWDEDPEWSVADWKWDVSNDDTRLSYWDWVKHNREMEEPVKKQKKGTVGHGR